MDKKDRALIWGCRGWAQASMCPQLFSTPFPPPALSGKPSTNSAPTPAPSLIAALFEGVEREREIDFASSVKEVTALA